jgi:DNA-binding phage protein
MSAPQLNRWNSAEHLKTKEDIAAYVAACHEEAGDDPEFMARVKAVVARANSAGQALNKPSSED